jgi:D-xylose transport system substrate-binding protein
MPVPSFRGRGRGLRAFACIAAACTAALVLAACGSDNSSGAGGSDNSPGAGGEGDGSLIGVSFHTNAQQRWAFEEEILKDAAAKNGDEAIVNYANDNVTTQTNQVQSMLQRGIDTLVITPIDGAAAAPLVAQAKAQGVKVIAYDVPVEGADYLIIRNGVEAGEVQAQALVDAVGCGDIALIKGDPAIVNYHQAVEGWDKVLADAPECINVVYDQDTKNWDTAAAQASAEAALQQNPNIKGFLTMWDGGAQGIIPALKAAGKKPGEVYVTGLDASGPSLTYIAEGWQGSSVWTPIDEMATDAASAAHDFAAGETPPSDEEVDGTPTNYVELVNVDKNNLCDFVNEISPDGWTTVEAVYGSAQSDCA